VSGIIWAILALALHLCPAVVTTAHGQGSRKDDIVFNTRGVPLAEATVRVCAMPASGQPCTPLALIYSDAALTQALANPTATDGLGNYNFYAAPGKYQIEISGPGITTKQIPNVILPSGPSAPTFNSISSTGGISAFSNLTGNLTVNGSTTVVGNLASGSVSLTNVGTPPGAPGAGTLNLYGKSVDKRLHYKDETGVEIGPISTGGSGAQTNLPNTFPAAQTIDADFHTKGPNPSYDVTRYGGYIGPNYNTPTTGSISSGTTTLTLANALDFANEHGILILGAGPSPKIATPTGVTAAAVGATGSTSYYYCVVDEDYANGRTACSAAGSVSNAVATLGLQTFTLASCNRVSGLVTCQTTAAHNFVSGSQVDIPRNTTGDGGFEGTFTITSIPDATHFTFTQYGVADKSISKGTARVAGRVAVKWNAPANYTVAKHIIYRCSGGACALPANAANYIAVGVAIGNDSYYLDRGYGMYISAGFLANLDNADAPSTAPTATSNQWLPTIIAAGGGTTSITLANAASHTVSGAKVLHDNTPNLKAACAAMITGGTVLVPGTLNSAHEFPIASLFNMASCAGQTEIDFGTEVWATAPIIPKAASKLKGIASGTVSQTPNFYGVNNIAWFNGFAYPFILMEPGTSHDLSLEALQFACNQVDQSCIYQDAGTDGGGVVSIRYTDVYTIASSGSASYVAKGGFGYFWNGGGWTSMPSDFSGPPAVLLTLNCGAGQIGQLLPALLYANQTFAFGGMLMDSCGVVTSGAGGGGNMEFRQMLVEGNYGPVFRANTLPDAIAAVDFYNLTYADFMGGAATPLIDLTNSLAVGIRVVHPYCATGYQPVLQTSLSTTAYSGIEITNTYQGCNYVGANYYVKRDDQTSVDTYSNFAVALQGAAAKTYFIMGTPSPAQSVVASAGGNVSIGTHTYVVTANDFDGGETIASLPITGTATSGNQTLTVTLPTTFPPGAAGVNLYRDGSLVAANGCYEPQFTTPGGTYVDSASFTCGAVMPLQTRAGTSSITTNGVSTTRLRINGEALTGAPRGEQNIFLPGALTTTWVASTWTPDKAVSITRVQVQAKTAPAACATNAVVRLTDGTTPVNLTVAAAANDSGVLTQNYAAGIPLSVSVQTAAAGCTTAPADANVTIQYRMQ
jgi:hypothetical protein